MNTAGSVPGSGRFHYYSGELSPVHNHEPPAITNETVSLNLHLQLREVQALAREVPASSQN